MLECESTLDPLVAATAYHHVFISFRSTFQFACLRRSASSSRRTHALHQRPTLQVFRFVLVAFFLAEFLGVGLVSYLAQWRYTSTRTAACLCKGLPPCYSTLCIGLGRRHPGHNYMQPAESTRRW